MRVHVVGAGGFAREVLDIIEALQATGAALTVAGFYADARSDDAELAERGFEVIGEVAALHEPTSSDAYVIGFGDGPGRRRVHALLDARGWRAASLVHPTASVGGATRLGAGAILCAGARITTNVSVGDHVHVNLNATVGHDAVLGDYVTVNPLASISGRVIVGAETMIGTGANVVEGVRIGERAIVGAGAVVVRDVAPGTTVAGVPARPIGQ